MKKTSMIVAASVSVGLLLAAPAASATGDRGVDPTPHAHAAEVAAHWTPARRAAAIPRDLVLDEAGSAYLDPGNGHSLPYGHGRAAGIEAAAPQPALKPGGGNSKPTTISSAHWTGAGQVARSTGRLYFEMPDPATGAPLGYVCSGSTVQDGAGGSSLILTAAHCVYDDVSKVFADNVMFIPNQDATTGSRTDSDCSNDPMGCWAPTHGVVDVDWTTGTFPDNIPWDYAFYVVPSTGAHEGNGSSESLEAAGTLPIQFSAPALGGFTDAFGYSYNRDPNLMYCAQGLATNGSANWWLSKCRLTGGSSGGPWIQPLVSGSGPVISLNSWGYVGGPGMAGPKLSGTSAQCLFSAAQGPSVPTAGGLVPSNC